MQPKLLLRYFFLAALLACFGACRNPDTKRTEGNYFDLAGYFKAEAAKFQKSNPRIRKSVSQNGERQEKTTSIKNWEAEFDLFLQSDINKPAWRGSYDELKNGEFLIYTAKSPELRTQKVIVKKKRGKISYIVIANAVHNLLYTSRERLTYYPDSLYRIEKNQQIRIIGHNKYVVNGTLKPRL